MNEAKFENHKKEKTQNRTKKPKQKKTRRRL